MSDRTPSGGHAMDLLQQYDDHRMKKDQMIKDIEENVDVVPERANHNKRLYREIQLLKDQIKLKDLEIEKLQSTIVLLKAKNQSTNLNNTPAESVAYTTSRITIASPQQVETTPNEESTPANFSPESKHKLSTFANLMDSVFEVENTIPPSTHLAAPIIINKQDLESQSTDTITKNESTIQEMSSSLSSSASSSSSSSASSNSSASLSSVSTNSVVQAPVISQVPLFIQPNEFNTISIDVLSTIYQEQNGQILISVIDKKSNKEIFKFQKTVNKIFEFNSLLKNHLSLAQLRLIPILPDRSVFQLMIPSRINERRERLNDYFASFIKLPNLSDQLILKFLQFISTDTLMIPTFAEENVTKQGYLIIRKSRTLNTGYFWKLRYATLKNSTLYLSNETNNQLIETIRLKNATIELLPNLPDDRFGTHNGFIINEHKKTALSNITRHYLCCEKAKDREEWISTVNELLVSSLSTSISNPSSSSSTNMNTYFTNSSTDKIHTTTSSNDDILRKTSDTSSTSDFSDINDLNSESKINKMRNLFPFKKLTTNATITNDSNDTLPILTQHQQENVQYNDQSVTKSLEMMNLESPMKNVFGVPLQECLKLSSHTYQGVYELPSIIYRCLEFLYKNHGLQAEGIFRLSGSSAQIRMLQEKFNKQHDIDLCQYNEISNNEMTINSNDTSLDAPLKPHIDINIVTGLMKLYLRNLPHLIFGDDNYTVFKKIVEEVQDQAKVAIEFKKVIDSSMVPKPCISLMYALFELLIRINEQSRINKMTLKNLCIVFSPTLNIPINILQPFIVDFGCIFRNEQPIDRSKREQLNIYIPQM